MMCRFNHGGDCCNSGAAQYMCKCKKPCENIVPITNADSIRAMSDEELAKLICKHKPMHSWPEGVREIYFSTRMTGVEAWTEWLQQPAEVE